MRIIFPVAGKGLRLRPHTLTKPKCLLPVAGNTIIGHIIDLLKDTSVSEYVFITGYMGDTVKEYISEEYSNINSSFVEQNNPQGLGEAISLCSEALNSDESVMIILGDTVFEADLNIISSLETNALCVREVDDPRRFGVVCENNEGIITKLIEKPETFISNKAIVGIYYIKEPKILKEKLDYIISNNIRTRGEFQLTDALELMIKDNCIFKTVEVDAWLDCGTAENMLETNTKLLENHSNITKTFPNSKIIKPCFISEKAFIENSNIGPNVSVLAGVTIKDSTISNSIISKNATITDSALNDSIVGKNAQVNNANGIVNISDYSTLGKPNS